MEGLSNFPLPLADLQEGKDQYKTTLRVYQQNRWQISDNPTSSDSESELSGSGIHLEPISMERVIRKIRTYTECLQDIGQSLQHPALDYSDDEKTPFLEINQHSAEDYYTERLRAKFPTAEIDMLQCLGRMNWHRYQRVQKERELNAQRQGVIIPDGKSSAVYSEFVDSGLGTCPPAATSSYEASVKSLTSSVVGCKQVHIPPLSAEAKDGLPFDCVACGDRVSYTTDYNWRSVKSLSKYDLESSTDTGNICTGIYSRTLAFSQIALSSSSLSVTVRIGPHTWNFSTSSDRIGRDPNAHYVSKPWMKGREPLPATSLGIWKT